MWDLLVITAGNEKQAEDFRLQLEFIPWRQFAKAVKVVPDPPEQGRIGSGGSTLFVLNGLFEQYGNQFQQTKILLLHSGGLSQRMPHLSAFGKLFAVLPGPTTALELKLKTYRLFPSLLPAGGLLVAASDVIEDTRKFVKVVEKDVEMVLFATESDEVTASQHGVFVMGKDEKLEFVLQKPSIDEMRREGAVMEDGNVLTDCFYWVGFRLCKKLASLTGKRPISEEICCYGDFMRPLGISPRLDYLKTGPPNLQLWRQDLAGIFTGIEPKLINLRQDAFFHLGTPSELLGHFNSASSFAKKFISNGDPAYRCVFSKMPEFEATSFVEFCHLPSAKIGKNCILSGLKSCEALKIPENVMMFTLTCQYGFITVAFGIGDDIKRKEGKLKWMGWETGIENHSLWSAPLFPIEKTKEESLRSTLKMKHSCFSNSPGLISLENALKMVNLEETIKEREQMKKNLI